MIETMSTFDLSPLSFVVLGLLARDGPSTPYGLKRAVGRGMATFWPFPHSQIYAETERLAMLGLLAVEQEETGRRRRTYRLTEMGRASLAAWLAEPSAEPFQLRSLGLLKLYFGHFAHPEDRATLAEAELALLAPLLTFVDEAIERLRGRADRRWQLQSAEMIRDLTQVMIKHWARVEAGSRAEAAHSRPRRRRQPPDGRAAGVAEFVARRVRARAPASSKRW
jgi:PadR family transcriptional regulator, regulatory protein AphA